MPAEGAAILHQVEGLLRQFLNLGYDTPLKEPIAGFLQQVVSPGIHQLSAQAAGQGGTPQQTGGMDPAQMADMQGGQGQAGLPPQEPDAGAAQPDQGAPPDQGGITDADLAELAAQSGGATPDQGMPQDQGPPPQKEAPPRDAFKGAQRNAARAAQEKGGFDKLGESRRAAKDQKRKKGSKVPAGKQ